MDRARVMHWLQNGASASDTLVRLLKREGLWSEFEGTQSAPKARRKPVKPRVRREKPVKVKKRKEKPVEAAAEENAPVAEHVAETPVESPAPAEEQEGGAQ
jgi:hypothetical protein